MTDTDDSPDDKVADGGEAQADTPLTEREQLGEHYRSIRQTRKRRAVGLAVIAGIIGFLFVQALNATDVIGERSGYNWNFFFSSVESYIPITDYAGVPFVDFGKYFSYIQENNLIYDPEVGQLLWDLQLYAFFFEELGMFSIFGLAGTTLAMGFAGTIMGFPLALLFGTLGSERVTPFPFNFIFRGTMSFIRSIPGLVWVLVFIPLAGISAAAATIAIATDTIGNLGRLFVDELEEIEDGPIEAMKTTGASRPQLIVFGMLSQVKSAFIAWTLYILEINVRLAVGVGVIGAGGLGNAVEVERGLRQFTNMMAALLCIFVLILSVELFSQRLRARLRSDEEKMSIYELIVGFPHRFTESMFK